MGIQIYDKADKIEKDGTVYYFVKDGSKNCFSFGSRIGKDWFQEYPQREVRESDWKLVATKKVGSYGKIADTNLNCPTSYIYGRIMFGNKYNIALYLDKKKTIKFEDLQEQQQYNVSIIIDRYSTSEWVIDLDKPVPEEKAKKVCT